MKRVILTLWSLLAINWFCEMGEMLTNEFNMFEAALGQLDWYLYTIKLQRMHSMLLSNAQQRVTHNGFANTVCSRDSMKAVI